MSTTTVTYNAATVSMRRILYFGVSLIAVVFSLLGFSQNVSERTQLLPVWSVPSFVLLLALPLALVVGAPWMKLSLLRVLAAAQILVFCIALLTWPLALVANHVDDGARPWIFGHFATTVSLVGILLPELAAWVVIAGLSAASGVLRIVAEGADAANNAIQDALFNLMIATILVSIIQVTLRAGRARDNAAAATAGALTASAALEAKNVQRSRVAAIIHDDVISTLIAAARFDDSPDTLVRGYARKALGRLDALQAGGGRADQTISSDAFTATLRSIAPLLAGEVTFTTVGQSIDLPAPVSEALLEAASEALRNSERHSGASKRSVGVRTAGSGIAVTVGDDGLGFDLNHLPTERFGIAVSIRQRMSLVDGTSAIVTRPGSGTRVILGWATP